MSCLIHKAGHSGPFSQEHGGTNELNTSCPYKATESMPHWCAESPEMVGDGTGNNIHACAQEGDGLWDLHSLCLKLFTFGLEISHTSPRMLALNFHAEQKLRTVKCFLSQVTVFLSGDHNKQTLRLVLSLSCFQWGPKPGPTVLGTLLYGQRWWFHFLGFPCGFPQSLCLWECLLLKVMKMLGHNTIQLTNRI